MLLQYLIFAVFVTSQVSSGFFDYDYDNENEKFKLQEEEPPANTSNSYVTEQSLNYHNLNNDSEQQPYWLAYNQNGEANPSQIRKTNFPSYFASRKSQNHNKNEKVHIVYATSTNSQYSSLNNQEPDVTNPDLLHSILSADSNAPKAKNAKNVKESKTYKEKSKQIYNLKNNSRDKFSEFVQRRKENLSEENSEKELNKSISQEVGNFSIFLTEDLQHTTQDQVATVLLPTTESSYTESTSETGTLGTTVFTAVEMSTTPLPESEIGDSDLEYDYLGNRNDQIYITNAPTINDFTSSDQIQTTTMITGFGITSDILESTTPMDSIIDEAEDLTVSDGPDNYHYDYSYLNDLINSSVDSVINYFKGSNTSESLESFNTTSLETNSKDVLNTTYTELDEESGVFKDSTKSNNSEYDYESYYYADTQNINFNEDSEINAQDKFNETKIDTITGFVPKSTDIDVGEKDSESLLMKYDFKHKSDAKMKTKYEKLEAKFGKFKTNRIPFMLESGLKMVDEKVNENSTVANETIGHDNSTIMPFDGIHSYPLNSSFHENQTMVDEIVESTSIPEFKPLPENETFDAIIPDIEEQIKGPFDEETDNINEPSPAESSRGFTYDKFIKQAQKSIYDKYDRKPKPFSKSDYSHKSYHRPIPKIRKEKDQELSFISAITNMGESIAHLSDKRKGINKSTGKNDITESTTYHPKISKPIKDEAVESTTYHPKMLMTKKNEITESTTYHPNLIISNSQKVPDYSSVWKTKMLRRKDEESDDMTTTASSQSPDEVIESGLRRNDEVFYGDDSIGSAWIGLGEYFKTGPHKAHQTSDLYDEEFIKTLIEDRSENVNDLEYVEDASEEEGWTEEEPKMKHASLNVHKGIYGDRLAYDLSSDRLLKKGKVIRSSSFFGQVPKMFKKQLKPKKSGVSGYIKNKVGQTESIDFGMPSLKFASRSDESMMIDFYNVIEKIGHELGQDVSGGYGMVGPRQSYDGVPGLVFLPSGTFSVKTKETSNRRSAKEQIIPIAVPQPVTVPVPQPIPVRILQPVAVTIPVPIPVERTVPIRVERRIPVPVEKPVYVHVVKRIPVPVIKPYPVPFPVYKTQYIMHDMPDPNIPSIPEFKGIPNDPVHPELFYSNTTPHPELSNVQPTDQKHPILADSLAGQSNSESVHSGTQNSEGVPLNTGSKHTEQGYENKGPKMSESAPENNNRQPETTSDNFRLTHVEPVNGLNRPETYYVITNNNRPGYVPGYKNNEPIHPELAHISSGLIHPEAGLVNIVRHPESPQVKSRPRPDTLHDNSGTSRPEVTHASAGKKQRKPTRVNPKPIHPEAVIVHNVIHKHPESDKKHHPDHKRHPGHLHPNFKDVNNIKNNLKLKEIPKDHKHYEPWSSVHAQGTHLRARQEVTKA